MIKARTMSLNLFNQSKLGEWQRRRIKALHDFLAIRRLIFLRIAFLFVFLHFPSSHAYAEDINNSSLEPETNAKFSKHPPSSQYRSPEKIALIAHWYNDFGLASTRLSKGKLGASTWYNWAWAREGNPSGYDNSRHPVLGWYKGDDPIVLDWQCYWLKEYGISGINLVGAGINTAEWHDNKSKYHWMYQLFNNAPNCKALKYIVWEQSEAKSFAALQASWLAVLNNLHLKYENFFYIAKNGKKFPVIYLFEGESLQKNLDQFSATKETRKFLLWVAKEYRRKGFGGISIFSRHPTSSLIGDTALEQEGVLYYGAGYSGVDGVPNAQSYKDYVDRYSPPPAGIIPNVVTSHESKLPHPSKWTQTGSSPSLFCRLLMQAAEKAPEVNGRKIVGIYNVSEWAEGGAGLQPNMRDGFGYLQAVKQVAETASARSDHGAECKFNNQMP